MRSEALLRVGRATRDRPDGMIISFSGVGGFCTAAEMQAYYLMGAVPPALRNFADIERRATILRQLAEARFFTNTPRDQLPDFRERGTRRDNVDALIVACQRRRTHVETHGLDLRWGTSDRLYHAIVMVDIPNDFSKNVMDADGEIRTSYRIDYSTHASSGSVTGWNDRRAMTPVPRGETEWANTVIEEVTHAR